MKEVMRKHHLTAPVLENRAVVSDIYLMRLEARSIAENALPGQFLMARIGQGLDPLLRRPFSIHAVYEERYIEILYKVVGKGTRLLSQVGPGDDVDVIGPLGSGFRLNEERPSLLLGGGLGIAPLFFLAQHMKGKGGSGKTSVFVGARTGTEILCAEEFSELGLDVKVATEDGSAGIKGLVTDLITDEILVQKPTIFSCGPYPMLRAVAHLSFNRNLPCQVSLETFMACGVGVCLGCVAEMKSGDLVRVCKEGPVFEAGEVKWT